MLNSHETYGMFYPSNCYSSKEGKVQPVKPYSMFRLAAGMISGIIVFSHVLFGQQRADSIDAIQAKAPKVFIDCQSCDEDFIRIEIGFVNYVRDPKEADVHFLLTDQRTGSGGREHTLTLIGQHSFSGMNDTLVYVSKESDTQDMIRKGIVRVLKTGLIRYSMRTPLSDFLSVNYSRSSNQKAVTDDWDYWVFRVSVNSFGNGEKQRLYQSLYGSVSANRVTEQWKINVSASSNYSADKYEIDSTLTIKNFRRSQSFSGLVVKSVDDHWSIGLSGSASASTYNNTESSFFLAPAIEYDLFPYSQSTREQLRFTYKLGFNLTNYREATIYDKTSENYISQSLAIALEMKQTWGTISGTLSGRHYPGNFRNAGKSLRDQMSWSVFGVVSWRIIEGLSFNVAGDYSEIHDQFGLVKRDLSQEDILLQRSQLETNYSYFFSVGFSYTFGSIFNNIVNPRMGSGGGGGISISISD